MISFRPRFGGDFIVFKQKNLPWRLTYEQLCDIMKEYTGNFVQVAYMRAR
jgi:hypothetical protein